MERIFLLCLRAAFFATFWSGILLYYVFTEFFWVSLSVLSVFVFIWLLPSLTERTEVFFICGICFGQGYLF